MNKIYVEIAELSEKFREMCYGLTTNETDIEEAVQELCLYFMQMNPDTLKSIYEKDGRNGLIRYGAVVLRRALTSTRSPFYYKYKKYYTNLTYTSTRTQENVNDFYKSIYNLPEILEEHQYERLEIIDQELDKLHWYDQSIFKLYYYEEGNTLDSLAKKTGISRNSLFTTIDKVREILKKELNE